MTVLDQNGVPQLALSADTAAKVRDAHLDALEEWLRADGDVLKHQLIGEIVFVENKRPMGVDEDGNRVALLTPDVTMFRIGSETLDEAAKSVVGTFENYHGYDRPRWVSSTHPLLADVLAEHWDCEVTEVRGVKPATPLPEIDNTRVAIGRDIESAACFQFASMFAGTTATAPTGTTFTTDAVNIPANTVVGQYIVTTSGATRFGIIQSNTSATNSVLTIDRWYNASSLPANRGVAAASTPTAGAWLILPGNVPAAYMGLTANNGAASDGDTTLTGEITTAGGGLIRQLPTYAHTAAATTTTLTQTFTCNGSDSLPVTVAKIGVFQGVEAASRIFFETLLNATMTFSLSGDQGQVTETVTL